MTRPTTPEPVWDDLRVLLAVHRHRSFLHAGKALGLSTSTAARRVAALEAALGRALVHRTSSGTFVVPEAQALVALAEQLSLGLDVVRRDDRRSALAGSVRISIGEGFTFPVTEALARFREAHPETSIELSVEARFVDLARREADLGIRLVRSSSEVLVERPLGRVGFALFASESYLARRLPTRRLTAADVAAQDFLGYDGALRRLPQEQWLVAHGAVRFPFRSASDHALLAAAAAGQGIVLLSPVLARLRDLARIEPGPELQGLPAVDAWLVAHRESRAIPRVRAVAIALERAFREGAEPPTPRAPARAPRDTSAVRRATPAKRSGRGRRV
jgi:DNA-binding transcriptional LysR family regulator